MGDLEEALGTRSDQATSTQQEVLDVAERNPDMKQTEIAEVVGCSETTVSRALQKHGDPADEGRRVEEKQSDGGGNGLIWVIIIALVLGGLAILSQDGEAVMLIATL